MIQEGPYPGKREALSHFDITNLQTARAVNSLVTTNHRNVEAIRVETVQAAYNFLSERLHSEQDIIMTAMKDLLLTRVMREFITTGITLSDRLFPGQTGKFADEVCEQWNTISEVPYLPTGSDSGCTLPVHLRKLMQATTRLV